MPRAIRSSTTRARRAASKSSFLGTGIWRRSATSPARRVALSRQKPCLQTTTGQKSDKYLASFCQILTACLAALCRIAPCRQHDQSGPEQSVCGFVLPNLAPESDWPPKPGPLTLRPTTRKAPYTLIFLVRFAKSRAYLLGFVFQRGAGWDYFPMLGLAASKSRMANFRRELARRS